jgi:hypothetical protein
MSVPTADEPEVTSGGVGRPLTTAVSAAEVEVWPRNAD